MMNNDFSPPSIFIRTCLSLVFLLSYTTITEAQTDVLKTRNATQNVSFEEYDGQNFHFRDHKTGDKQSVARLNVDKLTLTQPRMAEVIVAGKSGQEKMLLKGYTNGRFLFSAAGREQTLVGMNVKSIKPVPASSKPASTGRSPMQQIAERDIQTLLNRPGLTSDQKAILHDHKTAKAEYNAFQAESSALVAAMDAMTGNQRQTALQALRQRKEAEQPVLQKMQTSQQAVLAAFPELLTGNLAAADASHTGNTEPFETITITMPVLGEHEVLIIDTGIFRQLGTLNDTQSSVLATYDTAAAAYQQTAADPMQGSPNDVLKNLKKAQSDLFKAFPNVKVINQDM